MAGSTSNRTLGSGSISSTNKSKRSLLSTPGSKHKKNDDVDEESRPGRGDFVEATYYKENEKKLDALANSVTSIRNISKNIGK